MDFEQTIEFARGLDRKDPLKKFRREFHIPRIKGKESIYFCGNSLGLQPRGTEKIVREELSDWARLGVEGHFRARRPWLYYHKESKASLARLTGAKPAEVVAMNQLTVNLHLLLTSFYRPTKQRFRIIAEAGAFSSDQYVLESQIRLHGLDPATTLVEIQPRTGETFLRTDDIIATIEKHASELALVLFGAVQYYSGQFFDIGAITAATHKAWALAGFDLAHAIGNVPLNLHDQDVDFATWCSYKYLNSGPGGVAGIYIHERHGKNHDLPRLAGWWGHHEKERFKMKKGFIPMEGAEGWQLSNFPVLSGAALLGSLRSFDKAGMAALRKKSLLLTGYLEWLLNQIDPDQSHFSIITPANPDERGCQLSLLMKGSGKKIFERITHAGVIADWREPDVIRIAPVPLYNTFEEVFRFSEILAKSLK